MTPMDPRDGMGPVGPTVPGGVWPPWTYPPERYYYQWAAETIPFEPSDRDIKAAIVERLKTNTYTKDEDIRVDVKQKVVILGGQVSGWLAKRAAGDDSWDTPGVVDVSNQIVPRTEAD